MNIISSQPSNSQRSKRNHERIGELAILPIFFKLQGKKAIIAGGTDAAAWKAELLAAAGANVHIYAEILDQEFDAIIANKPSSFTHHKRPWSADIINNAAIAIADAKTDGEAKAFYCAAKAAGVPINVIDKPEFCEFQFGSIVNRSPAIVSISTDGAAPILGQAIRRRIETLLPPSLQNWAKLAADIRGQVNERLEMGKKRRAFWEHFVDQAFSVTMNDKSEMKLLSAVDQIRKSNNLGKVTLVGAGPGDAELLTLKAVRALQAADVILFDDLVSTEVLELARREAKRMLVGKRGGRKSCKQEDINAMMVNFAKAGKNVVRLKSGDPMVFGRAGEEIAMLEAENISVSIVPGITSASAMAAQLGVSLTHRDHAQSVRFVTGHSRKGELPTDIDWQAVADRTATTIFYMGGRTAVKIGQTLISKGLDEQTPIVICSSISRSNSQMWSGVLGNISDGIASIGFDEPVLIGVGNVFEKTKSAKIISTAVLPARVSRINSKNI